MSEAAAPIAASRERDFRRMVALSAALHVALSLLAVVSLPSLHDDYELPAGAMIEMVTPAELALRTGEVAPAPRPKPKPAEPEPEPVVTPPPRPQPVEQIIIPEDTHRKPAKAKPPPSEVREVDTRPREADREEQVDLEDFLLEQRILSGEIPGKAQPNVQPQLVPGAGGTGAPDSPEVAAWKQRVRQHIKRNWGVQAGFRGKRLTTLVSVTLTSGGDILDYDTQRSSGNPWFDDSVERYLEGEDTLPPPPHSGEFQILFDGDF